MKQWIQILLGLLIGGLLVWVLSRSTNWQAVGRAMQEASIGWLLIAQIFIWLSFPVRVQRWTYIVRAAEPVTYRAMFSATQISYMASFTLLGRAGEVIRAVVLNRLTTISFTKAVALVGLDRLTDLVGLVVIMTVALLAFQPASDVVISEEVFGTAKPIVFAASQYHDGARAILAVMAIIVGGYMVLFFRPNFVLKISDSVLGAVSKSIALYIRGMIENFVDGLHVFRSPLGMAKSIFFSLITWLCGVAAISCMLNAFHIEYPWFLPFVMQALLAIFLGVPGAPGFVGQFHAPLVISLAMVLPAAEYDDANAKAFAILTHLANYPAIMGFGLYCLFRERMDIFEIKRAAADPPEPAGEGEPPGP